jgi:uncharacterized protein (TIGR02646 family)
MIRRDREQEAAPKELVEARGVGLSERAKVEAWMKDKKKVEAWMLGKGGGKKRDKKKDGPPDFKAYKTASVSVGLERLFQGKCAYCESLYTRTQPVDIEHWRPKAEVEALENGKATRVLGYPWLAMVWENLLPSCIDCNRARNQKVLRPDDKGALQWSDILQGKANQFPLLDESKRVKDHALPLDQEQPLLLDPCVDDPAFFFHFDNNGVILPKDEAPKDEAAKLRRSKALASIDVYALNRKGLVDERRERILLLRARFGLITTLVKLEAGAKDKATRALAHGLIDSEIEQLVAMSDARQPYALMTKQYVHGFLEDLKRP